jgi:3-methylfumaryl-CoA hydratase
MFVGGRLRLRRPLTIGAEAVREGIVRSTEEKRGRSGQLVFVRVGYRLGDDKGGTVDDDQDLVYREAAPPDGTAFGSPPATPVDLEDQGWTLGLDLTVDPVLLFRFSALTYNAHRIHYDRAWATSVEGYPGLVVHGPLQAIALAELCRRFLPGRRVTEFGFRALMPAFDEGPLRLRGRFGSDPDTLELVAFDVRGEATLRAEARLEG